MYKLYLHKSKELSSDQNSWEIEIYKEDFLVYNDFLHLVGDEFIRIKIICEKCNREFFDAAETMLEYSLRRSFFYLYLNYLIDEQERSFYSQNSNQVSTATTHSIFSEHKYFDAFSQRNPISNNYCINTIDSSGKIVFEMQTIDELLAFLYQTTFIHLGKMKKCVVCGEFYLTKSNSHAKTCPYTPKDQGRCMDFLIRANYDKKLKNDVLLKEYRKMYKRKYMETERRLNSSSSRDSVAQDLHFRTWSNTMQNIRKQYVSKNISPEEFRTHLNKLNKKNLFLNQ